MSAEGKPLDPSDPLRTFLRAAWIGAAVVVGLFALGEALTYATAVPAVCGTCHEMRPALDSWKTSGHTRVGCAECHETPRPWYAFPATMAERGVMLTRDLNIHWSRAGEPTTALASRVTTTTIPDSVCERCHDPSRKVTLRLGTLIDHEEHAKRNGSCLSCHLWTAHPVPGVERELLMMERCFTCHGRAASDAAPGTCDVCHPETFELRPPTHGPSEWRTGHGAPAMGRPAQCLMCHDQRYCLDCHGVQMPHPEGWERGATGHGVVAAGRRATCARCHQQGADFCSMCHHKGYEPAGGPWVDQHPELVGLRGTAYCLDCHGPTYCVGCHTRGLMGAPGSE